jgi:hypothetical protein
LRAREAVDEPATRDQIGSGSGLAAALSGADVLRRLRRRHSGRAPRVAYPARGPGVAFHSRLGPAEVRWPFRVCHDDPVGMPIRSIP